MNHLFAFLFSILMATQVWADQAYIKVGEAKAKKSNLAFPYFNNLGSNNSGSGTNMAAEIYTLAQKNLELSTYFDLISQSAYLEDFSKLALKPASQQSNGFKFEPLKTIGAEFLIRSGYQLVNNDYTVEMYLYHVGESKLIVGKRYKAPLSGAKDIGNTMANDILEALTGVRGPFSSKIVATADRTGSGNKEVVSMNWDGTDMQVHTNHNNVALSASWSPDVKKIAYSVFTTFIKKDNSRTMNVSLYVLDLMSGKRTLTSYRPGQNSGAIFSKDGQALYLAMSQGSGSADIYKINLKGEILNRLTKGPAGAINVEPSLNPDGSKIAFSSERGGRPMIYVMNSDGSNVKRLTFTGVFNASPSWSPDGKKIAFAGQDNNNFDIFVMDADGSNIVRVTSAKRPDGKPATHEDPSFSPDSRFVVYTSNRTGKNQVYVSSIDGTKERRVTNDNYNYFRPKWSNRME